MRISIQLSVALIAALTMLIGSAVDTSAQGRKDAVDIEVTLRDSACKYEVKTVSGDRLSEPEQNKFFMNAGGFLHVTATGTAARIEIEDDRQKRVKGFKKKGMLTLSAGEDDFLKLRAKRTKEEGSLHKVRIECCDGFKGSGACENPMESDSIKTSSVDVGGTQINRASAVPLETIFDWLFSDDEPSTGPPLPGGPDMDVHP